MAGVGRGPELGRLAGGGLFPPPLSPVYLPFRIVQGDPAAVSRRRRASRRLRASSHSACLSPPSCLAASPRRQRRLAARLGLVPLFLTSRHSSSPPRYTSSVRC